MRRAVIGLMVVLMAVAAWAENPSEASAPEGRFHLLGDFRKRPSYVRVGMLR